MDKKINMENTEYLSTMKILKSLQEKAERTDMEYQNKTLRVKFRINLNFQEPSPIRTKVITPPVDWFQEYKEKGNNFFKTQDFEKAIEYYDKSLTYKQDPSLYTNKAVANIKLKRFHSFIIHSRFVEAEFACDMAIGLDPTNAKAYYRRAVARTELGKFSDALVDVEKVLSLVPANKEATELMPTILKGIQTSESQQIKQTIIPPKIIPLDTVDRPEGLQSNKIPTTISEIKTKELIKEVKSEEKPVKINKGVKIPTNPPSSIYEFEEVFRELKDHGFEEYLKV
jgi:tetratricopeptide (TPR) repeat protein